MVETLMGAMETLREMAERTGGTLPPLEFRPGSDRLEEDSERRATLFAARVHDQIYDCWLVLRSRQAWELIRAVVPRGARPSAGRPYMPTVGFGRIRREVDQDGYEALAADVVMAVEQGRSFLERRSYVF